LELSLEAVMSTKSIHGTPDFNKTVFGFVAKNAGNVPIPEGSPCVFSFGNETANTFCVEMYAGTNATKCALVAGGAETTIPASATGHVIYEGVTNCWVTGTVGEQDWLALSETYPGLAAVHTVTDVDRRRFAIAMESSSGGRAKIRAYYVGWRR
jgi:hypothetical protein